MKSYLECVCVKRVIAVVNSDDGDDDIVVDAKMKKIVLAISYAIY